ncbi:oligosaccharide flippase family protein [Streptomyces griseorubiginosus]|uniref:oligosaccharide flippase family protein n=1 Tax=Streptomyces griseorubiginosus TaxID=67304 RepID=UPI002E80F9EB|nr:oligosaccharide flippase family protein [Streptomyces griseorubiginosus]WUB42913.1 oligosaccharide flippase family protein [Streptomyces griseorubiginosus]WUB51432.1 oligosaccharide flippase family protein [Streptomyces griseorubiginosus]
MGAGAPHGGDEALTGGELRRRAKAGVFVVSSRGLVILVLGFAGNVVVARLLDPHDFGVVAIGMSFVLFAGLVSDGGLGAGLIRRTEPPSSEELGALSALQLGVTLAMTGLAAALAVPLGRIASVTAVMVASMPFVALQFPGRILLERALLYRRLVAVEMSQVLCYQAWAIGTVAAGFGVWGLATATVVRALAGTVVMAFVCPAGLVRPRPTFRLIRPLVGFGLRFQAVNATWLLRDQLLNVSVAALGGVSQLGLWALAKRLMEVPYLILQSLWRVSFPTMSRLMSDRDRATRLVRQAVEITSVGMGFVLTTLAGSAPGLVPGVFGAQWRDAAAAVPGACLGLAVGGAVSVATQGYLYALGDARSVLRASLLQALTWFAVTLPLIAPLGVASVGLGWCAAGVVEALVLGRATRRRIPVGLFRPLLAPVLVGTGAAALGWAVSARGGGTLGSGLAGGGCSAVFYAVGMTLADRRLVRRTCGFATSSVRAALSRSRSEESG